MASAVKASRSGASDQQWCLTMLPLEIFFVGSVAAEVWDAKTFPTLVLEFWRRVGLPYLFS